MDCGVCQLRSSVGFCAECKVLLCEVCGIPCGHCGKLLCPDHAQETRGGRRLCAECMEQRREQREQRRHGRKHIEAPREVPEGTSFAALQGDLEDGTESEEEHEVEDEALVLSGYQPKPPWVISAWAAGTAVVVILVILVVPGFRTLAQPWSSFVVMAVCGLAVFWAVVGLTKHEYEEDRRRNFIGLGVAVVAFLMAVFAVYTNPRPEAVVKFEAAEDGRGDMDGEELRGWREQRLQRFADER